MTAAEARPTLRIGVDLGGTKIEALVIDAAGYERSRRRIPTPRGDYADTVSAVRALVLALEAEAGAPATVGIGIPGAVSRSTGLVKNANSTRLNGRPFVADLSGALAREVRVENDANCFALSEASDGAGAGHRTVFGVILGTGVGGGLVHDGRPWVGRNAIAGEWGHNELPARTEEHLPDTACWCGRRRCIETYLSGPALALDHARALAAGTPASGMPARPRHASVLVPPGDARPAAHAAASTDRTRLDAAAIVALARASDPAATATLERFHRRLASALATVVNVLDPDIVVLGGGLSNIGGVAAEVTARLPALVFSDRCTTPVVRNRHGDASGVRGAAWLWPAADGRP